MRFNTRRGQLELERAKEMIKFVLFVVLSTALIITSIWSCSSCSGCQKDDPGDKAENTAAENTAEELVRDPLTGVSTYPRLVNYENLLTADYVPPNLTYLRGIPNGTSVQLNFDAASAFTKLYHAMVNDGLGIIPLSGYRTYEEQESIFEYNIKLHLSEGMSEAAAREYTLRFVAVPGSSEHQYGRSLDVTIDGTTNHSFQKTEQGKWLIAHAHEYGFVIRYPSDKEDITKIAYEPWHLRYVGLEAAEYMSRYDICLEEYIDFVRTDNPYAYSEE